MADQAVSDRNKFKQETKAAWEKDREEMWGPQSEVSEALCDQFVKLWRIVIRRLYTCCFLC